MNDTLKAYAAGLTFGEYLADLRVHRAAFREMYERLAPVTEELMVDPPLANVRVLAISEDWCPDCVFNLPVLARIAEASDPASLRIVRRSQWTALAGTYPGRGGVSRIPTFVFLNQDGDVIGYWSERCAASQQWFDTFTKDHPMPAFDIRYGIPGAPLLEWMNLRISCERQRFFAGVWRDVLAGIRTVLSANTASYQQSGGGKALQSS